MPFLLPAFAILFIGCASAVPKQAEPEPAAAAECPAGEFGGFGVGETDGEALSEARSALAAQISSSVRVTSERTVSQRVSGGNEDLSSGYESRTVIESALPNAQDARIAGRKQSGSKTSIAVCMAKSDAAKGFLERQRLLADSLGLASIAEQGTEHPRHKNEAWRRTQMLYNEFAKIQSLLEGWGIASPYMAEEIYSKAREDYQAYCRDMKLHWESTGSQCSKAVFAELSKRANIEESACSKGLNLNFSCREDCKSTSTGIKCSLEPSLSIEPCGGEPYSRLFAKEPLAGSDRHNESSAKEKLLRNLPQSAFLEEWGAEIKKWEPQCVK